MNERKMQAKCSDRNSCDPHPSHVHKKYLDHRRRRHRHRRTYWVLRRRISWVGPQALAGRQERGAGPARGVVGRRQEGEGHRGQLGGLH